MAAGGEQREAGVDGAREDLYAVLGLKKECSAADLRTAYKKLAMRWHPDRCSSLRSSKTVDEAKIKFQAIQGAYSVLSDTNKRLLYDVGIYDSDDDANVSNLFTGMSEFLGEMAAMMSQVKPNVMEGGGETLEELQELFGEMFQAEMDAFCGGGAVAGANGSTRLRDGAYDCYRPTTAFPATPTAAAAPFYNGCRATLGGGLKRDGADTCSVKAKTVASFDAAAALGPGDAFCFGVHEGNGSSSVPARGRTGSGGKRRVVRKPKATPRNGVRASGDGAAAAAAE